jgi:hypothetical protein
LRALLDGIRSGRIVQGKPETYFGYKEMHGLLGLKYLGGTYGRSLQDQGLTDLNEWTRANDFPRITGLIVQKTTNEPVKGCFNVCKGNNDVWWRNEIDKAFAFDWSSHLECVSWRRGFHLDSIVAGLRLSA